MPFIFLWIMSGVVMASTLSCINLEPTLKKAIRSAIHEAYPRVAFRDLVITKLGEASPLECTSVSFEMPPKLMLKNDLILKLDVHNDAKPTRRVTQVYRFSGQVQVVRATRQLNRGDRVVASTYVNDTLPLGQLSPHMISQMPSTNVQFRNHIQPDDVIERWMLEPVPDVKKGDKVTAIVKKDALVLSLDGHVLENGVIGDSIKLQLNDKIMLGMVYDQKTVIINNI